MSLTTRPQQPGQTPAPQPALPAAVLALVRASTATLSVQPGLTLAATVLGTDPNGLTQLRAGNETLLLRLSRPLPAGAQVQVQLVPGPAGTPAIAVLPMPGPSNPADARAVLQASASLAPEAVPRAPAATAQVASITHPRIPAPLTTSGGATRPAPAAPVSPIATADAAAPAPIAERPVTPTLASLPQGGGNAVKSPAAHSVPGPVPASAGHGGTPTATAVTSLPSAGGAPVQATGAAAATASTDASVLPVAAGRPAFASGATTTIPNPPEAAGPIAQQPAPASSTRTTPLPLPAGTPSMQSLRAATPVAAARLEPVVVSTPVALVARSSPATSSVFPVAPGAAETPTRAAIVQRQTIAPLPQAAPMAGAVAAPAPPAGTASAAQPAPAITRTSAPPAAVTQTPVLVLNQPAQAAARQDSLVPLLQNLSLLQPRFAAFPQPIAEAALRLLAARLPLDRGHPSADTLRQAVARAGVVVSEGGRPGSTADVKTALLQLRQGLLGMLDAGEITPVTPVVRRPPPPLRDAQPRGIRSDPPTLPDGANPRDAARTLLQQTDAALSRLKLAQLASSPQDGARAGAPVPPDLTVELPMMLGQELGMAQLQVQRNGGGRGRKGARGWRLRFAVNFSVLGEVGAQVSLLAGTTNVTIWADRPETADVLEALLPELAPALGARGLTVGSVRVRRGIPPSGAPGAGQLMDRVG